MLLDNYRIIVNIEEVSSISTSLFQIKNIYKGSSRKKNCLQFV